MVRDQSCESVIERVSGGSSTLNDDALISFLHILKLFTGCVMILMSRS